MKALQSTSPRVKRAWRALLEGGWPVWLGIAFGATAVFLQVAASGLESASSEILAAPRASAQPHDAKRALDGGAGSAPHAPPYSMHLEDMGEVARRASSHGMRIDAIDVHSKPVASLALLKRCVELRLVGGYRDFRSFLDDLATVASNAWIEEIRIDAGDPVAGLQFSLKLSMLYRDPHRPGPGDARPQAQAWQAAGTGRTSARGSVNPFGGLAEPVRQAATRVVPTVAATKESTARPSAAPAEPNQAQFLPALMAPPLPFVAIGSINGASVTDGEPVAFVRQQEQLFVVRAGDAIGHAYRVESVGPQGVEFTYLPLRQRQVLALTP